MSLLYSCIHSDADENTRSTDCATGPDSVTVDVQERRLRRVLEMIESEPSRSVRELALEVRLSPAHLQRLFKQRTGVLIGGLVAEARLRRAAELLSASNMLIKEIAHAVGYKHHSSFVRAFHRRFALAPGSYRNSTITATHNPLVTKG